MKLFCYYAFCSVKNQIKKMFRSWVAIFLVVCILLGVVLGIGLGALTALLEPEEDVPGEEDVIGTPEEELPPDDEFKIEDISPEKMMAILELIAAAIILIMLFFNVVSADKNGSSIFLMADVNLLFSAPMKPQSVLLFRLMSQIFLMAFASIYLLFQLPNLIFNFGMDAMSAIAIMAAWIFCMIYGKLLNVLVYTVCSTHTKLKKFIRPVLYGILFVLVDVFYAYYQYAGTDWFGAADQFFNAPITRWIPVFGWLKGLIFWCVEQNWLCAGITLVLLVGGIAALSALVWHIKADFYEDAMAKSQETADRLAAAQSGNTAKRKKDRKDRIKRDGLNFGSGAQMFFCKTVYNRFRFAILHVFTKTSLFYLCVAVFFSAIMLLITKEGSFLVIGLVLCFMVFFRSLGNPLAADVDKSYFVTVPASPYAKVIWSLLGGSMDCALDLLPATVVGAILMQASPAEAIGCFLLALGLDFYASNVMLFMELSLPTSIALQIKQAVSVMFVYFGIVPIAAVVLVGAVLKLLVPFLFVGALAALAIGAVFYAFSPLFLVYGRK